MTRTIALLLAACSAPHVDLSAAWCRYSLVEIGEAPAVGSCWLAWARTDETALRLPGEDCDDWRREVVVQAGERIEVGGQATTVEGGAYRWEEC